MKHTYSVIITTVTVALSLLVGGCRWFATAPTVSPEQRVLYGTKVSPYVRKVAIVLHEKNIPFTLRQVLPAKILHAMQQPVPQDFQQASPLGKIPAYQEGDWHIADSSVIAAYLERCHPRPALYPTNPRDYAQALWLEQYADDAVYPVLFKIIFERIIKPNLLKQETDQGVVNEAQSQLPAIFDYLNNQLGDKEFLIGSTLSIADIAIGSQLATLAMLDMTNALDKWPALKAYMDRLMTRPSFKAALPE